MPEKHIKLNERKVKFEVEAFINVNKQKMISDYKFNFSLQKQIPSNDEGQISRIKAHKANLMRRLCILNETSYVFRLKFNLKQLIPAFKTTQIEG